MPASKKTRTAVKKSAPRKAVQKEIQWDEVPIFIHGIMPDKNPSTCRLLYRQLRDKVNAALKRSGKLEFSKEEIFITWGVPTEPPQSNTMDQYLSESERKLEAKVKKHMGSAYGGLFGLYGAIRDFTYYGVSDLLYYISADGERALRNHIFGYTAKMIARMDDGKRRFSLTIFGHSAGSLIAHDLLFHLFSNRKHPSEKEQGVFSEMEQLRDMIKAGRLRVNHLYTFGSPITPLILRSDTLVDFLRKDTLLDPAALGFRDDGDLNKPRWANFWSPYDLASCPVEFNYSNNDQLITDVKISSGWKDPNSAHQQYWKSDQMIDFIGKNF
jgi:hypothetical protein